VPRRTRRALLDAGAEADARQSGGWTPLQSAAHNGDLPLVELLLQHGADSAAVNDDGLDAAALAERSGDAETVERIRRAGG
jgi:ankyrin repeat protein